MIEVLGGFPDHVVAYGCHGHITKADYESVVMPDVTDRLTRNDNLRGYFVMGDDYCGVDLGARWEDAKLTLRHLLDWERIAMVTDIAWLRHAAQFYSLFGVFGAIRAFPSGEAAAAREWILQP